MAMLSTRRGEFNVVVSGPEAALPLMFSNSLGATHIMWERQAEALEGNFKVVCYDTRGHGDSSATPGDYAMADLGGDALAIMDALNLPQVDFCGLSMGGMIGMWLAKNAPTRIRRLVVANSATRIAPPSLWNERMATVSQHGMAAVADAIIARWFTADFIAQQPETVARIRLAMQKNPPHGYISCCAAVRDFDFQSQVSQIGHPVLVIAGDADPATPPALTKQIADAITGARFVLLPAAHLSNIECHHEFNQQLVAFFN